MKPYTHSVFIGRFQPFHVGHLYNITKALLLAEKLIILVGSSHRAPSIKNPFDYESRKKMIQADLKIAGIDMRQVTILPLSDWFYHEQGWKSEVIHLVSQHSNVESRIAIIGHQKDASSYYLKSFSSWDHIAIDNYKTFNATAFRDLYFGAGKIDASYMVSKTDAEGSYCILHQFMTTPQFSMLCEEYQVITSYQQSWQSAPYPPIFVTGDAMLICREHLLLIQRKYAPGKTQWALPGGFLDEGERIIDGIIRELYEETQIDIAKERLLKSLISVNAYDYPERSLRGRTITHVGLFKLEASQLPKVIAADDAMTAKWFTLSYVCQKMSNKLMDDHYQIIRNALA